MNKILWQSLKLTPVILGAGLLVNAQAQANDFDLAQAVDSDNNIINQLDQYSTEGTTNSQGQVTSVSQLSDVSPTDWAYEALRSLVERYGCIAGYPDRTFRGNRALSRYEFAAGLNACMQQIERLVAGGGGADEADLATLRRLVGEFETELATLGARVDNLEGRVAFLEDHQFSTTTKLNGEVIMGLTGSDNGNNVIFGNRARLALETSFTGRDTLVTRLSAGNMDNSFGVSGFNGEGTDIYRPLLDGGALNQTFNVGANGNNIELDWLAYYAPISFGNREIQTYIAAAGGIHSDYAQTTNPFFEDFDGGNGALSTFASSNPIYRIGGGAGAAVSFPLFGNSTLTAGYLATDSSAVSNPANPGVGSGLFEGGYSALGQLDLNFTENLQLGLTYVRAFGKAGTPLFGNITGTGAANNPVLNGTLASDYSADSYGAQAAFRLSPRVSLSGFFNYTDVSLKNGGASDDIYTYGGGVAFLDMLREGSVFGIFAGVQPYSANRSDALIADPDSDERKPFHLEVFYKYPVTDNISITPGIIYLNTTDQNNGRSIIGTLRTTFSF